MNGLIYRITNNINGKSYIGKTERGLEARWALHLRDKSAERCSHYPIYRALNKYGIENFTIECIEEDIPSEDINEREQYWIQYHNTYQNGYNCTLGGDGRSTVNISDNDIILAYHRTKSCLKVADLFQIDKGTVLNRLHKNGIEIKTDYQSKIIEQLDKNEQVVQEFPSAAAAARFLIGAEDSTSTTKIMAQNIRAVCKGKRNTAYGYKWRDKDAIL